MKSSIGILLAIPLLLASSCQKDQADEKPNIILIMADDMGYECLSTYGSQSYKTNLIYL